MSCCRSSSSCWGLRVGSMRPGGLDCLSALLLGDFKPASAGMSWCGPRRLAVCCCALAQVLLNWGVLLIISTVVGQLSQPLRDHSILLFFLGQGPASTAGP